MTRDDIIRWARYADLHECVKDGVGYVVRIPNLEKLEHFAALVAEREREACAKACEELPAAFKTAADEFNYKAVEPAAENYAAAIRARGET